MNSLMGAREALWEARLHTRIANVNVVAYKAILMEFARASIFDRPALRLPDYIWRAPYW